MRAHIRDPWTPQAIPRQLKGESSVGNSAGFAAMPKFNLLHDRHSLIQLLALGRPAPWNPRPLFTYKRTALADPRSVEVARTKSVARW